jgi:GntR family transcriptional regulator
MPRQAPYLRVADDLRARIAAGEWKVGERLPGRGDLGRYYGVGSTVVQRAQERLIIEGLLEGRAGSGTYVRTPRERRRMVRSRHGEWREGRPFVAEMREQGLVGTWESRTHARVVPQPEIAERLGIGPAELTVHTRYEFLANGRPVQLVDSWEPMALTGGTPVMLPEAGPLGGLGVAARMQSIGITVAYAAETPHPARATAEQANLLGVHVGDLVSRIERTYVGQDGRPVETADIIVPEARWQVTYEIPIQS